MNNVKTSLSVFMQVLVLSLLSVWAAAADSLDDQVKSLQAEVATLERDIDVLEKNLLFPPLTRVEVYLSLDARTDFVLNSVSLYLNDDEKSFHIYTREDIAALHMGGKQHLWEGNVALGQHRLSAVFKGEDGDGKTVEKKAVLGFEKTLAGKSLELMVSAAGKSNKPLFSVKDWGEK